MLIPKRSLVPSSDQVCELLKETGALREGHFEFPNGLHSSHYFQMPLAMRYHGNARVLNVALSRLLRREPEGIPVAFGIREALNADQIFWAEKDEGRYHFRQYLDARGIKCIIVDDIVRSGKVIAQMLNLVRQARAEVIAIGSLVHFKDAQLDTGGVPYYSLLDVETQFHSPETCPDCAAGEPLEKVWV
jgi:orotate phosphoribosyltransferase